MKIKIFLNIWLFAILLFFVSLQAGSVEKSAPATATPSIGQIVWVKGAVKAIGANKTERNLQRRSPIFTKDTIVTDKTSTGQVVFSDNSIVALREDTQMRIDEYNYGKNVPKGQSKYVASLVKGGFRTITGLIPKNNPDNYQVNTPVATIAVQGTSFSAVYRGQLFMKYYGGKPCVSNGKGTVCLDENKPYSTVTSSNSTPTLSNQAPEVFKQDLQLTPASFNPSLSPVGPPGSTGAPGAPGAPGKGGTVGSFCIGSL